MERQATKGSSSCIFDVSQQPMYLIVAYNYLLSTTRNVYLTSNLQKSTPCGRTWTWSALVFLSLVPGASNSYASSGLLAGNPEAGHAYPVKLKAVLGQARPQLAA